MTCTGSLYLWDDRRAGLREIYRILVRGGSAHLFEPHADGTADERHRIREALRRETPLRRVIGPVFIGTGVGTPHGTTSQHSPYLVETEAQAAHQQPDNEVMKHASQRVLGRCKGFIEKELSGWEAGI